MASKSNRMASRPGECLFLSEKFSDVDIKVRSEGYVWRYPAHSLVLRTGSEVLARRIDDDPGDNKVLTFIDLSPTTVFSLLRFLYTGEMTTDSTEAAMDLLGAAERFRVEPLAEECVRRILSGLTVCNACSLLEKATRLSSSGEPGSAAIVEACETLILDYGELVLGSDLVLSLSKAALERILASDYLNLRDEGTALAGLWRWGRAASCRAGTTLDDNQVTQHTKDLLPLVRFAFVRREGVVPEAVAKRIQKCGCEMMERPRSPFRLPLDLLRQSTPVALRSPLGSHSPGPPVIGDSSATRLLCAQVSCKADLILTALELDAVSDANCVTETLHFVVTAEDTGIDIHRQEVRWVWSRPLDEGRLLASSVLSLSAPLRLRREVLHSLHLVRAASDDPWTWALPGGRFADPLLLRLHTPLVLALNTLHVIAGVDAAWG